MRTLSLLLCALISAFIVTPAVALECANAGAALTTAPDDTADANATACGQSAVAGGDGSTALGFGATAPGGSSIALGYNAGSAGAASTALSYSASSDGAGSTALGYNASSASDYSTALGYSAAATGNYSMALGYSADTFGENSTAVGPFTNASGGYSTALGNNATATGVSSLALGRSASASGLNSISLGFTAFTNGVASTALGFAAQSEGDNSTALGYRALANEPDTVIIGAIAGVNFATTYAKVGIGTQTPAEAVDVERSDAAARFQLTSFTDNSSEAPQFIQRRARGTRAAPTVVQNNDNIGLFSFRGYNGTSMGGSRATITAQAAGTFSASSTPTRLIFSTTPVGQTAPQSVLVITPDGKVQVKGVNLNVPDYVFEDDYELMPLDELKSFIDENGHLPGIPSADEVNEGVHDLAGSDMAQLRKIEELTLYTLQQQEQLAAQQQRIAELEAQQERIDHLEAKLNRALTALD